MPQFDTWCSHVDQQAGAHTVRIMSADPARLALGIAATATAVPSHYAAEERLAGLLRRLGKPTAAAFIEGKLPTTKAIRSGDLGEIFATEWIAAVSGYQVPIKRLRWKDHRNMAMRGDDVIGLRQDAPQGPLLFLKAEAKSRVALTAAVVTEARAGLDRDEGLPAPHSLSFVADRLAETGNVALGDAILSTQLRREIRPQHVRHLTFVFSGNNPLGPLSGVLQGYAGAIEQWGVGLRVDGHADFVAAVFTKVIHDAND